MRDTNNATDEAEGGYLESPSSIVSTPRGTVALFCWTSDWRPRETLVRT